MTNTLSIPVWCEDRGNGIFRLKLAVQPGAKHTDVVGIHDACLKIKISAPPVDGAANDEIVSFLSKRLGIKQRQVLLISGAASRRKIVEVQGVSLEIVQNKLSPLS